MAINPAVSTYPSNDAKVNQAVVDVDIRAAVSDPSVTSAKALVVTTASPSGSGGPAGGGGVTSILPATGLTSVSRSGTITAGGTSQLLMAANSSRKAWMIQNQSSGILYVSGTNPATQDQDSMAIYPAQTHVADFNGQGALYIIGATMGQAFFAREYS